MKHAYGYKPDVLDSRDLKYREKVVHLPTPPAHVDLAPKMPPVVDQGQLGSCTGNGVAAVVDFLHCAPQSSTPWAGPSSRLQIYYDERVIEGTVKQDAGAQIRDGIKVVHKTGAALESLWPYKVSKFKTKPTAAVYKDAGSRKVSEYLSILSLPEMLDCLAKGFPFVFGFSVPASFESDAMAKTGHMVWNKKEQVVGGHCVVGVGYDEPTKMMKCRNSWGAWGDHGHFYMPFEFINDPSCASDFWTARK